MTQGTPSQKSPKFFMFLVGTLIGAGSLFLVIMQCSHGPENFAPQSVPPATSEMSVPIIEKVEPTDSGKKDIDSREEAMLEKLSKNSENIAERFEPYGIFAQQAESAGMYDVAETYYKKAFDLGPEAYNSYFAKPDVADFQINWSSMHVDKGELKEAADIAEKVYHQEVKLLGPENVHTIEAGTTFASSLGYVKRFKEKQELCEKLLATQEKLGKTKDGDYITSLRCLGESYQGQNNLPEAKHWYLKALAVASAEPELRTYTEDLEQTLAGFRAIKEPTE